ncbi:MAG TPA: hypothetical protein VNP20_23600 [Nocardioidaceae bacterium]|nr:hypothetical protein [Nocardioidaceae bacterium]
MTQPSEEQQFDEVYDGPDPDVESVEEAVELDDEGLTTDELRPEEEVTEFDPPQEPSTPTSEGLTARDEEYGETIDERLAQEEPDV